MCPRQNKPPATHRAVYFKLSHVPLICLTCLRLNPQRELLHKRPSKITTTKQQQNWPFSAGSNHLTSSDDTHVSYSSPFTLIVSCICFLISLHSLPFITSVGPRAFSFSRTHSSAWFPLTTIHTYHVLLYSSPTSVPQRLFNQILQSNSLIHTIATLTTQYNPFLFTDVQTIAHLSAFFPPPSPSPTR